MALHPDYSVIKQRQEGADGKIKRREEGEELTRLFKRAYVHMFNFVFF